MPRHIADHEFETYVIKNNKIVIVDFWAPWCAPCRAMAPILESIESKFVRDVEVIKINVDDEDRLAHVYNIQSIPTLIIFKDGQILTKLAGTTDERTLTLKLMELAKASTE